MKQSHLCIFIVVAVLSSKIVNSDDFNNVLDRCYLMQIQQSEPARTVSEIKNWCEKQIESSQVVLTEDNQSPLQERMLNESRLLDNPNAITPHKSNYMLPVTYVRKPNEEPYSHLNDFSPGQLEHLEAKFQMSFKVPVFKSIFKKQDRLFFGFTIQSYWQMYNSDFSSPFRETNYQPEIFYGFVNDLTVGEWTNRVNIVGIEHQSNGRSQPLSRSWNRIYAHFIWENDQWIIGLKPWYRLPENEKTELNQPDGDDNPDINQYLGHFEFSSAYKWDEQTFGVMLRNNLRSDNRGAIQVDWTFPMGKRFKGYAQYFNGYGESLIDYNQSIERFGIGVLLTELF